MNDDDLGDALEAPGALLNALLDGELDAQEAAAVDAHLAASAEARAELEALRAVRGSVRSLPAVEPPAGFIEHLLREGALDAIVAGDLSPAAAPEVLRAVPPLATPDAAASEPSPFVPAGTASGRGRPRRGPSFGRVAAAVGVAAAAVVVLLGITPVTDAVTPPVHAYAARHDQMMAAPPLPGADPSSTTSTAPSTTEVPVPGGTAPSPSTTLPGVAEAQAMSFAPVAPAALDTMDAPFVAPASIGTGALSRMAAYRSTAAPGAGTAPGGVLHVMYTDGTAVISVYEQAGAVEWDALPAGTSMTIDGDPAWMLRRGTDEVVVVARGAMVYTIVATAPHEMTMDMADELPRAAAASMPERAQAACRTMVVRFGFGD